MENENVLPTSEPAAADEAQQTTELESAPEAEQPEGEAKPEGEEKAEGEEKPKKEKTPEQREIDRLRRRVDNLTRQKYELRANMEGGAKVQQNSPQDDGDTVTLTKAQLQEIIAEQAKGLAPAISKQEAETQRRSGMLKSLEESWGREKFDSLSEELDEALGGMFDANNAPRPAAEALFYSDDMQGVIEYLTDPDNSEEARKFSNLSAVQAGREIVRIEQRLKDAREKAKAKPSNAPRPIESVKGGGSVAGMPDPSNTKAYIAWKNKQEQGSR